MKFSVIIPTYNEAGHIRTAVEALEKQNIPRNEIQIIVVDNGSKDTTVEIARRTHADKVIVEAKQGTNIARQRGFEESEGEIVAFLDADSIPPPDWLTRVKENLEREAVAAVSGPYDYHFKGWKKLMDYLYTHCIFAYLDKILYFIFRKKAGIIMGGNFAARREVIEQIGGLPPIIFFGDDAAIAMLISRRVGRVLWNTNLKVVSSPRRFESHGLFRSTLIYAWHYLKTYFLTP